jgi:hypothetical protein
METFEILSERYSQAAFRCISRQLVSQQGLHANCFASITISRPLYMRNVFQNIYGVRDERHIVTTVQVLGGYQQCRKIAAYDSPYTRTLIATPSKIWVHHLVCSATTQKLLQKIRTVQAVLQQTWNYAVFQDYTSTPSPDLYAPR